MDIKEKKKKKSAVIRHDTIHTQKEEKLTYTVIT